LFDNLNGGNAKGPPLRKWVSEGYPLRQEILIHLRIPI